MSKRLRLTLDEFEGMVNVGAFEPLWHKHVEFIRGELRERPALSPHRCDVSIFLTQWSWTCVTGREVDVATHCPFRIPALDSEPEPEMYWCERTRSLARLPEPQEVFLVVDVLEPTGEELCKEKILLYAEAGIKDYWVVDLRSRSLHVFRNPTSTG